MTEYQALARIDAVPLTLTGGRSLQDWLAHETALGPEGARRAKAAASGWRLSRSSAAAIASTTSRGSAPCVSRKAHVNRACRAKLHDFVRFVRA